MPRPRYLRQAGSAYKENQPTRFYVEIGGRYGLHVRFQKRTRRRARAIRLVPIPDVAAAVVYIAHVVVRVSRDALFKVQR